MTTPECECSAELDELRRLKRMYEQTVAEQRQFERDVEIRNHAELWDRIAHYVRFDVLTAAHKPLSELARLATRIPNKPTADELVGLRLAGQQVATLITQREIHHELSPIEAEMYRLRRAVQLAGEFLHNKAGVDSGARCVCLGCELHRMVNDPATGAADA